MQRPVVGQKVWLAGVVRHVHKGLKEQVVVKVGRKYFEVGDHMNDSRTIKFHLDTLRQVIDSSPWYALYFNEQDYHDEQERYRLQSEIRRAFDHFRSLDFTLDQLRRIHAIIREGKEDATVS